MRDMRIAHYLFWSAVFLLPVLAGLLLTPGLCLCTRLLKDNLQDSQFGARYHHLLAALLCCVGRGLRDEFDRQCWLVSILTNVAHRVRDATPSSRQVGPLNAQK